MSRSSRDLRPTSDGRLTITTSVIVTEEKGTFLGIDGIGVLYVFGTFTLVNVVTRNFLLGCLLASLVYLVLRLYLTGKPKNFLFYALLYPFRPKVYRHQCHDKKYILTGD